MNTATLLHVVPFPHGAPLMPRERFVSLVLSSAAVLHLALSAFTALAETNSFQTESPVHPLPTFQRVGLFQAEVDFSIGTGKADSSIVLGYWQDHAPGNMLAALNCEGGRGIQLPGGIYRWSFRLRRGSEPVQFAGSPVFRLSVWDVTTDEVIAQRAVHVSDFSSANAYYSKSLLHSTVGREGHRFEPRLYWESYVDGFVDWVALDAVSGYPVHDLEAKALVLDDLVQQVFLDPIPGTTENGLLVARRKDRLYPSGGSEERGDCATWLAYYTGAQALRLTARPGDAQALRNLEKGFRALHALHAVTGQPGVIARYADAAGNWHYQDPRNESWQAGRQVGTGPDGLPVFEEWSRTVISEDVTTAFAFAVGMGYEHIADQELKALIGADIRAVARHFLSNDFGIVTEGRRVDLNPYIGLTDAELDAYLAEFLDPRSGSVESALDGYQRFAALRDQYNGLVGLTEIAQLLTLGCIQSFDRIPNPLLTNESDLVQALNSRDAARLKTLLPNVVPELYGRIFWLRDFLKRQLSAVRQAFDCIGRLPNTAPGDRFSKLLGFADVVVASLDDLLAKLPSSISGIQDIKFHAGHAIAAAHLLSVARTIWPDEFTEPYYDALRGPDKNLLWVMETWGPVPEKWSTLIGGDFAADRQRSAVRHRSFVALFNLIRLEPDEQVRGIYKRAFEQGWQADADEGNPLYDILRAASGAAPPGAVPTDLCVAAWSLSLLPFINTGQSLDFWRGIHDELNDVAGGVLEWNEGDGKGRSRDPVPANLRSGQMFLWQRNPREFGYDGEAERRVFPSIDYLLPYWLARASGLLTTNPLPDPARVMLPRIRPAEFVKSTGDVGLTIGQGTGTSQECKGKSGLLYAIPELISLPGPYGPVNVPRDGMTIGWVHTRMLTTDNDWRLTINPQPEGIYWDCQVCRAGGIEKPGSEIGFRIEIVKPAATYDQPYAVTCPPIIVASSGEQGVSLGSALRSDCKELHFSVGMPAQHQPIAGQLGRINLGGNGFEDPFVHVRVIEYHRVEWFYIEKFAERVDVHARICRPSGFNGGAAIKVAVDLRAPAPCPYELTALSTSLAFESRQGEEAASQVLALSERSGRSAPWMAQAITASGGPWLRVSSTAGFMPDTIQLRASARNLNTSQSPYTATIRIDIPGALATPQFLTVIYRVLPSQAPLLQACCDFNIQSPSLSVPAAGGSLVWEVQTVPACAWEIPWLVHSDADWLSLQDPASSAASGRLVLEATANRGCAVREGQVILRDQRLNIIQAAAPPTLGIVRTRLSPSSEAVRLSWLADSDSCQVESAMDLGPSAHWVPISGDAIAIDGTYSMTVPITGARQFFRLNVRPR